MSLSAIDLRVIAKSLKRIFIAFGAVAVWSSVPLTLRLFVTLKRHGGVYFWSILATSWGLCIREIGYILSFLVPGSPLWLTSIFSQGGWIAMVLGFSVMLYSRLNLILESRAIRQRILIMIVVVGCIFYPFMATLSIAQTALRHNGQLHEYAAWSRVMTPMERIQLVFILGQENIISFFYTQAAYQYLHNRFEDRGKTRKAMLLLLAVQILILLIDIAILVIDFAGMLEVKLFIHSFVYSVKLELEFVVLNQLVDISKLGVPGLPTCSFDPEHGNKQIDLKSPVGADAMGLKPIRSKPIRSPDDISLFENESSATYRPSIAIRSVSELDQATSHSTGNSSDSTLDGIGTYPAAELSPTLTNRTSEVEQHNDKNGTTVHTNGT